LYFRRIYNGDIQNNNGSYCGWVKILDVENFRAYAEKNGILTSNNFAKFGATFIDGYIKSKGFIAKVSKDSNSQA
jgi:hypothetical protein